MNPLAVFFGDFTIEISITVKKFSYRTYVFPHDYLSYVDVNNVYRKTCLFDKDRKVIFELRGNATFLAVMCFSRYYRRSNLTGFSVISVAFIIHPAHGCTLYCSPRSLFLHSATNLK